MRRWLLFIMLMGVAAAAGAQVRTIPKEAQRGEIGGRDLRQRARILDDGVDRFAQANRGVNYGYNGSNASMRGETMSPVR